MLLQKTTQGTQTSCLLAGHGDLPDALNSLAARPTFNPVRFPNLTRHPFFNYDILGAWFQGNVLIGSRRELAVRFTDERKYVVSEASVYHYDLVDAGPGLGAFTCDDLPESAIQILHEIETADALVVASPVYKGSYAGLLKHLFDLLDPFCIAGKRFFSLRLGEGSVMR